MSIKTVPVQRWFDLQRKYVEQSVENVKKGADVHKKAVKQVDPKTPLEAYNRNLKAGKTLIDSYFDAVEEFLPQDLGVEQQKELYDEAYKAFKESNEEVGKAIEQNLENSLEAYYETVEENVEILDEQIDLLFEGLDQVEDQTVQTVEKTKEVVEEE